MSSFSTSELRLMKGLLTTVMALTIVASVSGEKAIVPEVYALENQTDEALDSPVATAKSKRYSSYKGKVPFHRLG
jgi:phosphohistidine swiveling domain-containing protein